MFYSLLYLTALLSQLQDASAAPLSTQTRAVASTTSLPSIAALNNLVVMGDGAGSTNVGDVSFSFYSWAGSVTGGLTENNYVEALSGTAANTVTAAASTDLAGNTFLGLGHDVAIADMSTVFVSQTSTAGQTGRVVVYEGNITSYQQTQLLIPYDGKHRLDSSAAFGESIAAKEETLAVGCQNCNTSAPIYSGAVYVYKPNKEGRWSESQVLSAPGVLFLGEQVAMHNKVLLAAGDDVNTFSRASLHNYENVANSVVVFEEKGPKFEQRQVLTPMAGGKRESITGVTVFDETIAITTMGSDTSATFTQRDKVYVYYPMNKRYGLEPKGKPSPQQWTNIQILTTDTSTYTRYAGGPHTSISGNELQYLTTDATTAKIAKATRTCQSCKFSTPALTADTGVAVAQTDSVLTSDASAFYTFQRTASADLLDTPDFNNYEDKCLNIMLADQYHDGWGIASLVVSSPSGREDRFTLQCASENPHLFKYCPSTFEGGKYHIHIDKGEETPFGWELSYQVAAGSSWYAGDKHTHMDFLWDEKYEDFHIGASKGVLPQIETCEICDPNKPAAKHRSLSNLRSLHHKGQTSSPTMSQAPTLVSSGNGDMWNEFSISTPTAAWFSSAPGASAKFMISDPKGKKLHRSGTGCYAVASKCWVELPDGDYVVRVGQGTSTASNIATATWQFCGTSNPVVMNTAFEFSIVDQQCYVGLYTPLTAVCTSSSSGVLSAPISLNVDVLLSGGAQALSGSDKSSLALGVSETMMAVAGTTPSSARVARESVGPSGVTATVVVEFNSAPDMTALNNFVRDTSSASSLLKFELIGSQSLASKFLQGEVSGVSILSASTSEEHDFSGIDESSFHTVTDHAWKTASIEQESNNFTEYAKYVAEGAYALVAVAAVLAVSLFVKNAMSKRSAAVAASVIAAAPPGSFESVNEEMDSSSDEEVAKVDTKRVNLTSAPKRSINISQMKQLIDDEDAVFNAFLNKSRK